LRYWSCDTRAMFGLCRTIMVSFLALGVLARRAGSASDKPGGQQSTAAVMTLPDGETFSNAPAVLLMRSSGCRIVFSCQDREPLAGRRSPYMTALTNDAEGGRSLGSSPWTFDMVGSDTSRRFERLA
jgi:hypothetical protein